MRKSTVDTAGVCVRTGHCDDPRIGQRPRAGDADGCDLIQRFNGSLQFCRRHVRVNFDAVASHRLITDDRVSNKPRTQCVRVVTVVQGHSIQTVAQCHRLRLLERTVDGAWRYDIKQQRRTIGTEEISAVVGKVIAIKVLSFAQISLTADHAARLFAGDAVIRRIHLMRTGDIALHIPHLRNVRTQLQIDRLNVGVQQAACIDRVVARAAIETDILDAVQQHPIRADRQSRIFLLPQQSRICRFGQIERVVVQVGVCLSHRDGFELISRTSSAGDLKIGASGLSKRSVIPADDVIACTTIDRDCTRSGIDRVVSVFACDDVDPAAAENLVEAMSAANGIVAVTAIDDVAGEVAGGKVRVGERHKTAVAVRVRS